MTTSGVAPPRRVKRRVVSGQVALRWDAVPTKNPFRKPFCSIRNPLGQMRRRKGLVVHASDDDNESNGSNSTPLNMGALIAELTDMKSFGQRDELYFVGQMVILFCLVFPPVGGDVTKADLGLTPSLFDPVIGLSLLLLSFVFVTEGISSLGNSLTPFPKPREDNELIVSGAYQATRHPMYSGLIFGSCGLALITGSPVRTLLAASLAVLLYFKSQKEEGYLVEKHGDEYLEYQKNVPRLVPNVVGIGALLESAFGKLEKE